MRLTLELLGWTLTVAAEQPALEEEPANDPGSSTTYPVAHGEVMGGEPYDDRARFGFGSGR